MVREFDPLQHGRVSAIAWRVFRALGKMLAENLHANSVVVLDGERASYLAAALE